MSNVTLTAPTGAVLVESAGGWKLMTDAGYVPLPPFLLHALRVSGITGGAVSVPAASVPRLLAAGFSYPDPSAADVGQPNGLATLDEDGVLTAAQIPASLATTESVGQVSASVANLPVSFSRYRPEKPAGGEVLLKLLPTEIYTFPEGWTGSRAVADIAATAETVLTIKGPVWNAEAEPPAWEQGSVGTITFAIAGTVGVFAGDGLSISTDGVLTVEGPAEADATLAGIAVALSGVRGTV